MHVRVLLQGARQLLTQKRLIKPDHLLVLELGNRPALVRVQLEAIYRRVVFIGHHRQRDVLAIPMGAVVPGLLVLVRFLLQISLFSRAPTASQFLQPTLFFSTQVSLLLRSFLSLFRVVIVSPFVLFRKLVVQVRV